MRCDDDINDGPVVFKRSRPAPEGPQRIVQGNRRRSERRAELAPAIPSEEEEDGSQRPGFVDRRNVRPARAKALENQ